MMRSKMVCEHGCEAGKNRLPVGGWNGPVGQCSCCLCYFGYIDSTSHDQAGSRGRTWTPKNLCMGCGGKYENWSVEPGKRGSD